jgi:hypothetical protein
MTSTYKNLLGNRQKDWESQIDYLSSLKAARVEGMIVEHEAESAFFSSSVQNSDWRKFTSRVLFCGSFVDRAFRRWFTIVYDQFSHDEDCRLVQAALQKTGYPVRLLDVRGADPAYRHDVYGSRLDDPITLSFCETPPADVKVIDKAKVRSVFWGYAIHNSDLVNRFISETILKDHFVSEGQRAEDKPNVFVSDVDALLIGPENDIAVVEIKHKDRTKGGMIGLNNAPSRMALALVRNGIRFLYLFLEKPRKIKSTMYLYFDRDSREKAQWFACEVQESDLTGELKDGPAHTALSGRKGVGYVEIAFSRFTPLGTNYERSSTLLTSFLRLLKREDKK